MKILTYNLIFMLFFLLAGCSSFIKESDEDHLRAYEKNGGADKIYLLQKEVKINGEKLSKNSKVKIIIVSDNEWVKVYAYRASENMLNSSRFLVLYLFEDDFPDEKFSNKVFEKEFKKVLKRIK